MSTEDPFSGILRFSWTVILQPLSLFWCGNVTFLSPNKKVTKEVGIGKALS